MSGQIALVYVEFYRRRLPHLHAVGQPLFVTFRLYGSLPRHRAFPTTSMTSGQAFLAMDRLLDVARCGPLYLKQAEIAELTVAAIEYGAASLGFYDCHAYVVMANHIHLLLTPRVPVRRLIAGLKSTTAREANALLGRTGKPFWQEENYDRLVRNEEEFRRIVRYIEMNPVKAGLVHRVEDFRYSSGTAHRAALFWAKEGGVDGADDR